MADLLKGLNAEQKTAVQHKEGPLLIVAGAGTGKTTVIARRVAWLIESQKVDPERILALTFMDKATAEMEDRVNDLLPLGYPDLWINTFHAFGERVLKEVALEVGLNPGFKLLSEPEQWLFIRKHLFDFKLDYYRPLGNPSRFIRALAHHFSRAKDEDISSAQYLEYADKLAADFKKTKLKGEEKDALEEEVKKTKELASAYDTYQKLLIEEGLMDFGDLITNTLHVLRTRKSILERYRKQFEYILVDEFQDTNYAQYQLVKLLAAPKNNITVVGDDDQSIYKFRGAAVSNILSFQKDYPKAKSVVLTNNYRTTQKILDAAYKSISNNNPDRLETKLKIDKKLKSQQGTGQKPAHLAAETVEQEAAMTVKEIVSLKDKNKKRNWKDFAILVRANSHAEPFLKLLAARNIPFQFYAARGLYAKPEVTDLIAYLRVLTDLRDSVSIYRLMSSELFEIPVTDTIRLINLARTRNLSLYEILEGVNEIEKISEQGTDEIDRMMHIINEHIDLSRKHTVGQLLYKFVEDTGKLKEWLGEADLDSTTRVMNVNQFFKRVLAFEQAAEDKTVRSFIDELNLLMEAGENPAPANPEEGPDAVSVMTIHGSKGLEFPVVFVANLVKERFPGRKRNEELPLPQKLIEEEVPEEEPHLQEERRLFYVAMTRAKEKLYLTTAQDYGGARLKKVSPFIEEIDKYLKIKKSKDASWIFLSTSFWFLSLPVL
ncbi:ATP-dependent helicase [Patescibacteria group bacterium]